jgi:hypothetical protein
MQKRCRNCAEANTLYVCGMLDTLKPRRVVSYLAESLVSLDSWCDLRRTTVTRTGTTAAVTHHKLPQLKARVDDGTEHQKELLYHHEKESICRRHD